MKTITAFTRIVDANDKYTGEVYDLLDEKVLVFLSICDDTGIDPSYLVPCSLPKNANCKSKRFPTTPYSSNRRLWPAVLEAQAPL
jgi:hypothetical protein